MSPGRPNVADTKFPVQFKASLDLLRLLFNRDVLFRLAPMIYDLWVLVAGTVK